MTTPYDPTPEPHQRPGNNPSYGTPGYGAPGEPSGPHAGQGGPGGYNPTPGSGQYDPPPSPGQYTPAPGRYTPAPGQPAGARPGLVTAALVLSLIGGIFLVLFGAVIVFAGTALIAEVGAQLGLTAEMDLIAGAVTFVGGAVLVWGALLVIMSIFAFRRANWARWVIIIMAVPAVLLALLGLSFGDVSALVQLAWIGTSAGLLLTPAARAWYAANPNPAAGGYGH